MSSEKSKKTALVTGAAGFMGSHLVDYLLSEDYQVVGVDDLSGGYKQNINPQSEFYKIDLRETEKTIVLIKRIRPLIIYHLAADATEGRSQFTPIQCTQRNYLAHLNLLVGSIQAGVKRVVFTSSMSVYGDQKPPFSENMPVRPVDIYGISKAAMEQATQVLSKVYGFEYTILRPHNVYGPRQNIADPYRNVIGIFINRMLQGKHFFIYGDGNQKRSFSYIEDVTPYIAKAGFLKKTNGEIINIGSTELHTVNEVAQEVLSYFVKDLRKIPKHLRPIYLPDRPQEVKYAYCTDDKARSILGFKNTTPLKVGIKKMLDWAKKLGPQEFKYLEDLELASSKIPKTWEKKLI